LPRGAPRSVQDMSAFGASGFTGALEEDHTRPNAVVGPVPPL
jgi:hypothetical protein